MWGAGDLRWKMNVVEKLKNCNKKSRNRLVSGFFVGARGGT